MSQKIRKKNWKNIKLKNLGFENLPILSAINLIYITKKKNSYFLNFQYLLVKKNLTFRKFRFCVWRERKFRQIFLMVQLMKSGNPKPDPETTSCREKVPVKLEIVEDSLDEEHGPLNKRSKPSSTLQQQVCLIPEKDWENKRN